MNKVAANHARPVALTTRPSSESVGHHWTILLLCLVVLGLGVLLGLDGTTGVRLPGPPVRLPEVCLTKRMTGHDCPGCGLTRSVVSMMHGDLDGAFQFNPAGPLMFLLIAVQLPLRSIALWRIRSDRAPLYLPGGFAPMGFVIFAMMVQWLVRAYFGLFWG